MDNETEQAQSAPDDATATITLPPAPRRDWRSWVVDYNPFYLLSAVSMLLGLLTLSNTTTWNPVPMSTLLPLVATLAVYQLACLGVGVLLYRKLGPRRDAVQLLVLVMLFGADISFLMSEIATESVAIGAAVSAALLALALGQVAAILKLVRPTLDPALLVSGVVGLIALHAVPVALTAIDDNNGGVTPLTFYGLWWIIGLSPLIAQQIGRKLVVPRSAWMTTVAALPWASLAVHAGVLHYVYDRPFMAPHAAPILIGGALLLRGKGRAGDFAFFRNAMLAAAAWCSLGSPPRLAFDLPLIDATITTATVGLAAAWLAVAYVNVPRLLPAFAAAGVLAVLAKLFGPTFEQVAAAMRWAFDVIRRFVVAIVPRTRTAWGVVAVASAFAFLGLGALLSFGRRDTGESVEPDAHV